MIREIGSFRFPGFYESIFCNSDEFIDDEDQTRFEIEEIIESDNFEVVFDYDNFDEYKTDVCKEFMKCYVDKIHEVLPNDITDHEDFKFDIVEDEDNIVVISPKYYNYSTDRCFCDIETNRKTLKMIKEHTLRLPGVKEYIRNNFTSYDGFISFITNNFDEWKALDIEDYEENMLIALLDMLISLSDCTGFYNIIEDVYYNIDKYCYASGTIYYQEKDDKIAKNDIQILKDNNITFKTV